MQSLKLGDILIALLFISSFITTITNLYSQIKKPLQSVIAKELKPINDKIDDLTQKQDLNRLRVLQNDLVNYINDVESGINKSEIQQLNAHKEYDEYCKVGGNSYVHEHLEKLKQQGKF